jgi:diguanylate cyclase (GGDEF)-like protein
MTIDGMGPRHRGPSLWALPRTTLAYVCSIDLLAIAVTVVVARGADPIPGPAWRTFVVLMVASALHLEAVRGIERRREQTPPSAPYTDLKSIWVFAGVLLLPLDMVIALVGFSYLYASARVQQNSQPYRKVFSAATFVLASGAAELVLTATDDPVPADLWSLLVVVTAAAVWWLVNLGLVIQAIVLVRPGTTYRQAIGDPANQLVVVAGLGLGIAVAALQATRPWVVPVIGLTVLALHRGFLMPQLREAARTDPKTGLATAAVWAGAVPAALDRAGTFGDSVGMLMLDLDHFKRINDTHGHPVGDRLLRAVAACVTEEVRRGDLVARIGGDELAVLLPQVDTAELVSIAERIRTRLGQLTVPIEGKEVISGVPASIGLAVYPDVASTVDQLVLAADNALLTAKHSGRNKIVTATR